jgi:hypothetical protein
MKGKTIGAGAAVLLAMAFLGCSWQDAPEYDEQGRRLVTVSIPTRAYEQGGLRSLNKTNALNAWDYVEVVFKLPGEAADKYFIGYANKHSSISITLPVGTHKAVMFAGVASGKKLLAVGVATEVDGTEDIPSGGEVEITPDTTTITFTLSPLKTNIANSSFLITGPTTPNNYATTPSQIPTFELDSKVTPYFFLPEDSQTITGTFTIDGFDVPDVADLFATSLGENQLFGIAGKADSIKSNIILSAGIWATIEDPSTTFDPVVVTGKITTAAISTGDLVLTFGLTTPDTSGRALGKIRFDVPIQAFTPSSTGNFFSSGLGSIWYIVNGTNPISLDTGGEDSSGENILLLISEAYESNPGNIGGAKTEGVPIEVTPGWDDD